VVQKDYNVAPAAFGKINFSQIFVLLFGASFLALLDYFCTDAGSLGETGAVER